MSSRRGLCALCKSPTNYLCTHCESVYYCSEQHYYLDWRKHQLSCRCYQVAYDVNRYVVASKTINAGELIVTETPLVLGPHYAQTLCLFCVGCCRALASAHHFFCPRCLWPACRPDCPGLTDKARHANECVFLRIVTYNVIPRIDFESFDLLKALLPLRVFLLKATNPLKWKVLTNCMLQLETSLSDSSFREVADTASFVQTAISAIQEETQYRPGNETLQSARQILAFLSEHCIPIRKVPFSYGRIVESFGPEIGRNDVLAVYSVVSCMEHSYLHNTRLDFEPFEPLDPRPDYWRGQVIVRARKKIANGERITTPFVNTLSCTLDRQLELWERNNVSCLHARSMDHTDLGSTTSTSQSRSLEVSGRMSSYTASIYPKELFLDDMLPTNTCPTCTGPATLKCTGCFSVYYCNEDHQKAHWPQHRLSCNYVPKSNIFEEEN